MITYYTLKISFCVSTIEHFRKEISLPCSHISLMAQWLEHQTLDNLMGFGKGFDTNKTWGNYFLFFLVFVRIFKLTKARHCAFFANCFLVLSNRDFRKCTLQHLRHLILLSPIFFYNAPRFNTHPAPPPFSICLRNLCKIIRYYAIYIQRGFCCCDR